MKIKVFEFILNILSIAPLDLFINGDKKCNTASWNSSANATNCRHFSFFNLYGERKGSTTYKQCPGAMYLN